MRTLLAKETSVSHFSEKLHYLLSYDQSPHLKCPVMNSDSCCFAQQSYVIENLKILLNRKYDGWFQEVILLGN